MKTFAATQQQTRLVLWLNIEGLKGLSYGNQGQ